MTSAFLASLCVLLPGLHGEGMDADLTLRAAGPRPFGRMRRGKPRRTAFARSLSPAGLFSKRTRLAEPIPSHRLQRNATQLASPPHASRPCRLKLSVTSRRYFQAAPGGAGQHVNLRSIRAVWERPKVRTEGPEGRSEDDARR